LTHKIEYSYSTRWPIIKYEEQIENNMLTCFLSNFFFNSNE